MINLNENENQNDREPIPSGTKCVLQMRINQPGTNQKSDISMALTRSGSSDAHYLNCEFDVLSPAKHKGRKVFQNFTVQGGKTDAKGSIAGRISGAFLKAAWDAHNNLRPDDMSQAAVSKRMVPDYINFDGIVFPATVAIRAGSNGYPPKNEVYIVITPDKPEYAKLMAGEEVEPASIGILGEPKGNKAKPADAKPAWATGAAAPSPTGDQPGPAFNPAAPPAAATGTTDMRPAWAR